MAYDERVLDALRSALPRLTLEAGETLSEKRMFGGVCVCVNGKMLAGVSQSRLVVRLEPAELDAAQGAGRAQPMDFTGKPMRGFAYVEPDAFASEPEMLAWLQQSLRYVRRHML